MLYKSLLRVSCPLAESTMLSSTYLLSTKSLGVMHNYVTLEMALFDPPTHLHQTVASAAREDVVATLAQSLINK